MVILNLCSDTSARGILVSASSATTTIAPLIIFVLGTVMPWRNIALYMAVIQVVAIGVLFLVRKAIYHHPVSHDIHDFPKISSNSRFFPAHRFPNRQFGWCPKLVPYARLPHWNGCADGVWTIASMPNIKRWNATWTISMHVQIAANKKSNAHIQNQQLLKISPN